MDMGQLAKYRDMGQLAKCMDILVGQLAKYTDKGQLAKYLHGHRSVSIYLYMDIAW